MEVSIFCFILTFANLVEGDQNVKDIGHVTSEGELVELVLSNYEKGGRPVLNVSGTSYDMIQLKTISWYI